MVIKKKDLPKIFSACEGDTQPKKYLRRISLLEKVRDTFNSYRLEVEHEGTKKQSGGDQETVRGGMGNQTILSYTYRPIYRSIQAYQCKHCSD